MASNVGRELRGEWEHRVLSGRGVLSGGGGAYQLSRVRRQKAVARGSLASAGGQVPAGENWGSRSRTGDASVCGKGEVPPPLLTVSSSEVFCSRSDTLTAPTWCTTKRSKLVGCSFETAVWCPCTHWSCSGEAK